MSTHETDRDVAWLAHDLTADALYRTGLPFDLLGELRDERPVWRGAHRARREVSVLCRQLLRRFPTSRSPGPSPTWSPDSSRPSPYRSTTFPSG